MDTLISLAAAWVIQRAALPHIDYLTTVSSPFTLLLVATFTRTFISLARSFFFRRRASALGCSDAPRYPHKDLLLGLDIFFETLRAFKSHRLLELYRERFAQLGNTHYTLGLGRWTLMTCEPDNVKTILATRMDDWPIDGPRLYAPLPLLGPDSVFTANGQKWHEARARIRPSFVRDQVADLRCFDRHITNMVRAVPRDDGSSSSSSTFDIQHLLLAMTMDSSTDFMLGYSTNTLVSPSPEAEAFLRDFEYGSREGGQRARLGPLLFYIPHRKLDGAVQRIRKYLGFYLRRAITDKEKGGGGEKGGDRGYVFLDEVLKAGGSEDSTIDQILSIIVAGRDTTAAAMTAAFYYLARDPKAVEKLRREIAETSAGVPEGEMPTWEQLKGMRYLNNVLKEALRLFPPLPTNSRTSNKDTILPRGGGPDGKKPILIPKGTPVRWSLHAMHRRKDIYGPDAEEFRPERWDENLRVGWEYIPFHGGPRICIGQQFALTQMSYALYKFFKVFKSIEARDDGPFLVKTNLTATLANGCLISAVPA